MFIFISDCFLCSFWIFALMYIISSLFSSSCQFCNTSDSSLSRRSLRYPFFCRYLSIYPPRCHWYWSTVHDNWSVVFAFLNILFIIALFIFVPVFGFATIFHTSICIHGGKAPSRMVFLPFAVSWIPLYFFRAQLLQCIQVFCSDKQLLVINMAIQGVIKKGLDSFVVYSLF